MEKIDFEDVRESPADGIYVHGLYLEGASWSKKEQHLIDASRGELIKLLPVMYITGVLKQDKKLGYQVPVLLPMLCICVTTCTHLASRHRRPQLEFVRQ